MKKIIIFITLIIGLLSCDISKNKPLPQSQFTTIFENNNSGHDYFPLDIKQTADNGFLILAEIQVSTSDFPVLYLLKTDDKGKVLWEKRNDDLVSPTPNLIENGSEFQIIAMNKSTLLATLIKADETLSKVKSFSDVYYPLAAQKTSSGIALLSYNPEDRQSILTKLNSSGNTESTGKFDVFEDVRPLVFGHLTRQGKRKPFMTGELPTGKLFFNGFTNFTHALTFANANGSQSGIMNGVRYESALSAILPLSNGKFSATLFDVFGNARLAIQANINSESISSINSLEGNILQDLSLYSEVKLNKILLNNINCVALLANSKNGQAIIQIYDESAGKLIHTAYYGSGSKTEVCNLISTSDGGVALVVKMYVAGRFGRIMLYKLTKAQADAMGGKTI
ncbi:MAG: hypothetical protein EAZ27_02325 [Cytophagales bacterium]|nr:MAG: hypothetical protein EAZ27_02325 [Cytophagales bacterium]